jgi:hypothetical protein
MKLAVDTRQFRKDLNNIVEYSFGYIDGIHAGKAQFFKNLGLNISEMLQKYIDSNGDVIVYNIEKDDSREEETHS